MKVEKCDFIATSKGAPAIQHNNRLQRRQEMVLHLSNSTSGRRTSNRGNSGKIRNRSTEKTSKQKGSCFEFSFKGDGSLLSEGAWREEKVKNGTGLIPPVPHMNKVWSLQKLEQEIEASRVRHQARIALPPPPIRKPNCNAVPLYKASSKAAGDKQFSIRDHSTKATSLSNSYLSGVIPSETGNLLQSQTNKFPAIKYPSKSFSSSNHEVSSESTGMARAQPSNKTPATAGNKNDNDYEFADDLDDLLANMDEEALISQAPSTRSVQTFAKTAKCVSGNNSFSKHAESSSRIDYGSSASHYNLHSSVDNDVNSNTPHCTGHGLCCRILTAQSSANMGRKFYKCPLEERDQQCQFFQWVDEVDGRDWSNDVNRSSNGMISDGSFSNKDSAYYSNSDVPKSNFSNIAKGGHQGHNNNNGGNAASGFATRPIAGCKDIHRENKVKFGHRSFRPGQQSIIEHAVAGEDVFVLMPTGGGKSLCYQLPAWCCPGLTVVVSPLLSLIQDQVQSMTAQGVHSVFLNSSQDYESEQRAITQQLFATTANSGVKLLYLTPEKIRHSNVIQNILTRLYRDNLLNRFVIDEAHCLSDWGHDFRPDYAALNCLRESFPNVPLMALTATANERVVRDAIRALRMKQDCFLYRSSFNRPNLHYEVRKKDNKADDSICDYIVQRHQKDNRISGVIYCLSRKDCEKLSEKLQDKLRKRGMNRIQVSYYHAELDAYERERRHMEWSRGKVSVLCATIAFGMGIDKPDVRFVIHYSMPKSITHYYQESGRAGRDGDKADCILYYSYKDKQVLEGMIKKSSNNPYSPSTRRKVDQLYECLRYCEDDFECRRTSQLKHFGEQFDSSGCRGTCDNCRAGREPDKRDLTEAAICMLLLLSSIQAQRKNGAGVTLLQLTELFRGSKAKAPTKFLNLARLNGYGAASRFDLKKKHDIERVAHAMIFERILVEDSQENQQGFSVDYVQPGEKAAATRDGAYRFLVSFPKATAKTAGGKENLSISDGNKKKRKKKAMSRPSSDWTNRAESQEVLELLDDSDDGNSNDYQSAALQDGVLPPAMTLKLQKRIRKVVGMWADEEQMMGNKIYYWHIMKNDVIKSVALKCPTTSEELRAMGGLGEQKCKDYGERLIKIICSFIREEKLEDFVDIKEESVPVGKKRRVFDEAEGWEGDFMDDDDEFPLDFDVRDIVLPGDEAESGAAQHNNSKYF